MLNNIFEEKLFVKSDINIGLTVAYEEKNTKRPMVLLISGTGSLDRDGNSFAFKTNLYRDLSDMFVRMGYVCVRYDKRGTHESKTKKLNFGVSELVDDAALIIKEIKKLDYVDSERIVVCGHSEGAMIATLLTKKENLKGLILLGGACMSLKDASFYQNYLLIDQVKDMKGMLGWFLRKVIKSDDVDKQVNEMYDKADKCKNDVMFYKGSLFPVKYIKEHGMLSSEKYLEILKEYKGKVLAITGKSDVQADYKKLDLIKDLDNFDVVAPEGVNHLMKDIDNEPNILEIKNEYKMCLKKNISSKVKDSIENWSCKI